MDTHVDKLPFSFLLSFSTSCLAYLIVHPIKNLKVSTEIRWCYLTVWEVLLHIILSSLQIFYFEVGQAVDNSIYIWRIPGSERLDILSKITKLVNCKLLIRSQVYYPKNSYYLQHGLISIWTETQIHFYLYAGSHVHTCIHMHTYYTVDTWIPVITIGASLQQSISKYLTFGFRVKFYFLKN